MGIAKTTASIALAALSVAVTVAALSCYRPGLSRASLTPTPSLAHVGLSQLLALDRPEAPKAAAAEMANASNGELKDWSYTAHRSFSRAPSRFENQFGSLSSLLRQSFSFFSSSQFFSQTSGQFSGGSFVSTTSSFRSMSFSSRPGLGVFHRSHFFSRHFSAMHSFGFGSPFFQGFANFPGFPFFGSQGFGSPSFSPPFANTGTPAFVSSVTPPTFTPPAVTPPAPPAPVTSSSFISSVIQQVTDFANSSNFASVRVRALELVTTTVERIVTNVGGVTSSVERTTVVSSIQVEVRIRRFRNPNASPFA